MSGTESRPWSCDQTGFQSHAERRQHRRDFARVARSSKECTSTSEIRSHLKSNAEPRGHPAPGFFLCTRFAHRLGTPASAGSTAPQAAKPRTAVSRIAPTAWNAGLRPGPGVFSFCPRLRSAGLQTAVSVVVGAGRNLRDQHPRNRTLQARSIAWRREEGVARRLSVLRDQAARGVSSDFGG